MSLYTDATQGLKAVLDAHEAADAAAAQQATQQLSDLTGQRDAALLDAEGQRQRADALQQQLDECQAGQPPQATVLPGVYRPTNNQDLASWADGWNLKAETFYFNYGARPNTTLIGSALAAGRDVIFGWDSKVSEGVYTPLSEFADGRHDDALDRWLTAGNALLDQYPGRRLYLAPFHEVELNKRNPADTAAVAVAAQHHVAEFIHQAGSKMDVAYWAASGLRDAYYGDPADFDLTTADIYYRGTQAHGLTMTQVYQQWRDTLTRVGWDRVPRGITETGIVVEKFTSAEQIAWWRSAPDAIKAHDLRVWVAFMSDRDLHYVPTDPAVKAAMRDVYASLS